MQNYYEDINKYYPDKLIRAGLPPFFNVWIWIAGMYLLGTISFIATILAENKKYSLKADKIKAKEDEVDDGLCKYINGI